MEPNSVVSILMVIVGIVGAIIGIVSQIQKSTISERNEAELRSKDQQIKDKDKQIREFITMQVLLQSDLDKKQADLEKTNVLLSDQKRQTLLLERRIEEMETRIRDLEQMLYGAHMFRAVDVNKESRYKEPDTLLISSDPYIQQLDEIALKKAGVNYRRISVPTLDKIEQEIRRAKQRGERYKNIMISGHASEQGYKLTNGEYIDGYWLNQHLGGTEILFLNGCKTSSIADSVIDIIPCVISLLEDVETLVAQSFAEIFWRGIIDGDGVSESFANAIDTEPTIKPYAYLRCS